MILRRKYIFVGVIVLGMATVLLYQKIGPRFSASRSSLQNDQVSRLAEDGPSFYPEVARGDRSLTGAIIGSVKTQGRPLAKANVTAWLSPMSGGSFHALAPRRLVLTDKVGSFLIDSLLPGTYTVSFSAPGLLPDYNTGIEVIAGRSVAADANLQPGGISFTGYVRDVNRGSITGARVTAMRLIAAGSPPIVFETLSDDAGKFAIHLAPGRYLTRATHGGYAPATGELFLEGPSQRDFSLMPAGRVVGRVIDLSTRSPRQEAEVSIIPESASRSYLPVLTNALGEYSFDEIEAGRYRIWARYQDSVSGEQYIDVVAMADTRAADLLVSVGSTLAGIVTSGGMAVRDARVRVQSGREARDRPTVCMTDALGHFELRGVAAGEVSLMVEANGMATFQDRIDVGPKAGPPLKIVLIRAARIEGKVTEAGADPREVAVTLKWTAEDGTGYNLLQTTPDREGLFSFSSLRAGSGEIEAMLTGRSSADAHIGKLSAGEVKNVTLPLKKDGAWISGTVRLPKGAPAKGSTVIGHQSQASGNHLRLSAGVDEAGRFKIGPFRSGEAFLVATESGDSGSGLGSPAAAPDRAHVILTTGTEAAGVTLQLVERNLKIHGRVVDSKGVPLPGALVLLGNELLGIPSRRSLDLTRTLSGDDGRFTFDRLPDGQYTMWACSPGFVDAELNSIKAGADSVTLRLSGAATASGRVVEQNGTIVSDYDLLIFPVPSSVSGSGSHTYDMPLRRIHDADGAFAVGALSAGEYDFHVQAPGRKSGNARVKLGEEQSLTNLVVTISSAEGGELQKPSNQATP